TKELLFDPVAGTPGGISRPDGARNCFGVRLGATPSAHSFRSLSLASPAHFEDARDPQRFGEVFEIDPFLLRHVPDLTVLVLLLPQSLAFDGVAAVTALNAVFCRRPLPTFPDHTGEPLATVFDAVGRLRPPWRIEVAGFDGQLLHEFLCH